MLGGAVEQRCDEDHLAASCIWCHFLHAVPEGCISTSSTYAASCRDLSGWHEELANIFWGLNCMYGIIKKAFRNHRDKRRTPYATHQMVSCLEKSGDSATTVEELPLPVVTHRPADAKLIQLCQSLDLFKGASNEALQVIACTLKHEKVKRSAVVLAQGDGIAADSKLCIIATGTVTVHIYGSTPYDVTLGAGCMFGEIALLFGTSRNASVISNGCTMHTLTLAALQRCISCLPFARLLLFLRRQILLQILSDVELLEFARKVRCEKYVTGNVIIEEGQAGHTLYIVRHGSISIWRDQQQVASLGRNSVLGQRALHGKRRTATCIAVGEVELIAIDDFVMDGNITPMLSRILCCDAVVAVQQHARVFGSFTDEQLECVLRSLKENIYNKGDTIVQQGESMTAICVVRDGFTKGRAVAEAGGFQYFGSITGHPCPSDVVVDSERASVVRCSRDEIVSLLQANTSGVLLKDLVLEEEIGSGTSGKVRLARHRTAPERLYAVKTIPKASKTLHQAFTESAIMKSLSNPFCVRLYNIQEDIKEFHIIMEYVSGGELFKKLQDNRKFAEPQARFYMGCVILALEYLHRNGIVYRDLKPENLLVDDRGYLKLTDFGFAKRIGNQRTYTICGTPEYQAPEIMGYQGASTDADHWSLGVLAYELLTGVSPFVPTNVSRPHELAHDPWVIIRNAQQGRYIPPPGYENTLAYDLIKQLLEPDPCKRLCDFQIVKQHPWFAGFDWKALAAQRMPPPFKQTKKR